MKTEEVPRKEVLKKKALSIKTEAMIGLEGIEWSCIYRFLF